jgi:hypothetical protein
VPKSGSTDELVPVRGRIPARYATALHAEAVARRIPVGRLLAEILRAALPVAAAERVRASLPAPTHLRRVPDILTPRRLPPDAESPSSVDEGDCQPLQPFTTTIPVTPSLPQGDPDQGPPGGTATP